MPLELSLLIGIFFGAVAALMAFLIIYNEYQKHRLGRWRLWKEALTGGLVTFFVFVVLSVIVGYWTLHLVR
jgi:NADH:ubiquinone oxidoreductase subunit 6 (subunit J)